MKTWDISVLIRTTTSPPHFDAKDYGMSRVRGVNISNNEERVW